MDIDVTALAVVGVLVILDIITGLVKAWDGGEGGFSSQKMREGIAHKSTYAVVIALAEVIEWGSGHIDLGITAPLVTPVCVYIAITEITSILENVVAINPDLKDNGFLGLFGDRTKPDEKLTRS